jgi:hypothetical protein
LAINGIIFCKVGQTEIVINTKLAINRITIPKITILKKFSENDFNRKLDRIPSKRDKIRIKK